MSETSGINAALVELQGQLPRISKDLTAKVKSERTGAQYVYSYADLAQISREVLPLLSKLGLAFTSRPTMRDGRFVLIYELRHVSNEMISGEYPLPDRGSPQEVGGAITYARRYCLCAVTGVAPDDDDHDAIAAEKASKRRRTRGTERQEDGGERRPSPMNSVQQRRMQELFARMGLGPDDRDARLRYATEVVGRPLKSASELTGAEAAAVIERAESDIDIPSGGAA